MTEAGVAGLILHTAVCSKGNCRVMHMLLCRVLGCSPLNAVNSLTP